MPKFRKNFTDNHLSALKAVWRLVNATPMAIAYSQNMPNSRDYWRNYLNDMRDEGWLVSKLIFSTARTGKHGRNLGTLYALTREGAAMVAETFDLPVEEVFYPKNGIYASSPFQFPHRAEFIELLAKFLAHEKANHESFEILDLIPYYRHDGSNRLGTGHAVARVTVQGDYKSPYIVPDALMRFRVGDTVKLVAIEYHRETDTKAIIDQLRKHGAAIEQGVVSAIYGLESGSHVLSIHADADKLRRVKVRIEGGEFPHFDRYAAGFHFATFAGVMENGVAGEFWGLDKQKRALF